MSIYGDFDDLAAFSWKSDVPHVKAKTPEFVHRWSVLIVLRREVQDSFGVNVSRRNKFKGILVAIYWTETAKFDW